MPKGRQIAQEVEVEVEAEARAMSIEVGPIIFIIEHRVIHTVMAEMSACPCHITQNKSMPI